MCFSLDNVLQFVVEILHTSLEDIYQYIVYQCYLKIARLFAGQRDQTMLLRLMIL